MSTILPPITIAQAIANIENNHYLLPAIQREFVWGPNKVERLFDSIMRNYPIHSFLFWSVEGQTKNQYRFYSFIREYVADFKKHNPEYNTMGSGDFMAVLDGQQRLTALYIGLKGTYAWKKPRVHYVWNETNYPTRRLYLNIKEPASEEQSEEYIFRFLTNSDVSRQLDKWFLVGDILELKDFFTFSKYMKEKGYDDDEFSSKALSTLHSVVHITPTINAFLEKDQNIDKALNIFIRINSGGQPLSFSDLLMSITIANWKRLNARKEMHALTDEIFHMGFRVSNDYILRVFLFLHIKDVRYKVTNFTSENAELFEKNWKRIRESVIATFELIEKQYGYTDKTLPSYLALLPIIYYIYHKNIAKDIVQKSAYNEDRKIIKKWLAQVLVKKVFSGAADAILTNIRGAFTSNMQLGPITEDISRFPALEIAKTLRGTTKDMSLDNEYIDLLLHKTQINDPLAYSILSLLYPNFNYKIGTFHKDHIFAYSFFNKDNLIKENIPEDKHLFYLNPENYNSIINLQMLDANENMSKQNKKLDEWVEDECAKQNISREKFLSDHLLPEVIDFNSFDEFISQRKAILREYLKSVTL